MRYDASGLANLLADIESDFDEHHPVAGDRQQLFERIVVVCGWPS
jgi:hypothetical protein